MSKMGLTNLAKVVGHVVMVGGVVAHEVWYAHCTRIRFFYKKRKPHHTQLG
jgi:hypothetical protein